MNTKNLARPIGFALLASLCLGGSSISARAADDKKEDEAAWWNKEWTLRKPIVVTPISGAEPDGDAVTLLRLHGGNFQFALAKEDGSDLRLIAADGQTEIPYHIERYDSLMNEAFVWAKIPHVEPGKPATIWLYSGNPNATPPEFASKDTYPDSAILVYHFTERSAPPKDFSAGENNAATAPTPTEGALIGPGALFFGTNSIEIANSPNLTWAAGTEVTVSLWVKPSGLAENAMILTREEGGSAFRFGLDNGVPFVEVTDASGTTRSAAGEAIPASLWRHLAVVASATKIDILVDGKPNTSLARPLPALASDFLMGSTPEKGGGYAGEADELQIYQAALPVGDLRYAAISQSGSDEAQRMIAPGEDESSEGGGHNATLEHLSLFGDIAHNMMFDGWIAIGGCIIMLICGWTVAVQKFLYLNSIDKGTKAFLKLWDHIANDLTTLDHDNEDSIRSMGGKMSAKLYRHVHRSPLYHLYHIGCKEIRGRIGKGGRDPSKGLSARAIQAVRASLESGMTRENQRLNSGLVALTISIAGGPYMGLLGTVVGVMITFALISRSGEVEVASIAPGIASALLATVAGLLVAIPALFIYSYLSGRIKAFLADMQVFIDEFIAKMAEFHPTPGEAGASPAGSPVPTETPFESELPADTATATETAEPALA